MKPFLKWAGGKYRILNHIKRVLPAGKRLIEPFAGSGAVFLNTDYDTYLLADANPKLINLYLQLQKKGPAFIDACEEYFTPEYNNEVAFYTLRDSFNASRSVRHKAALFVYLNRHCFNGLCRYNGKGKFNVPFGRYQAPYFPRKEMLAFHEKSKKAVIRLADFRDTMDSAKAGDVVYCDPPYVPLSATANFTDYASGGFGMKEQAELAKRVKKLQARGVTVVISNHDTEFTQKAYAKAQILSFKVQRFISCDGANRGKAGEVLAVFA